MDCKVIDRQLLNIRRQAQAARLMLGGGNTGRQFSEALDAIEKSIAVICREQHRSERDARLTELWTALALPFDEALPVVRRYTNADYTLLFDERLVRWCSDNATAVAAWEKANRNLKGN